MGGWSLEDCILKGMIPSKPLYWLTVSAWLLASPVLADTEPGPARLVADFTPGSVALQGATPQGFTRIGNRSVFLYPDDEGRLALWVTDATVEGTKELEVLCPPCGLIGPLGSAGNVAFYHVTSGSPDYEFTIWRTDGTPAGTFPLTEGLSLAVAQETPPTASIQGGLLFFSACTAELGCELWASDGSLAGTALVGEILPGPPGAGVLHLAAAGDRAFLIVDIPGEPTSLWIADGRARTLRRVGTVPEARALATTAGRAFFIAQDVRDGGWEVWVSDGSAEGTRPVTRFAPRDPFQGASLTLLDGRAWFQANDGSHGFELWSVGAKPGSLARVTNTPGRFYAIADFAKAGERIVLASYPPKGGSPVLWASRGDHRSSAPLTGCPGGCPWPVGPFATLTRLETGRVVFYGHDRQGGGIWATDGTAAGTRLLQRTVAWSLSQAVAVGGLALIQVMEEYETGELWVTDGTAAGTLLVARGGPYWSHYWGWTGRLEAGMAGGRILFAGSRSADAPEIFEDLLWRSDGTPAGSSPLLRPQAAQGTDTAPPIAFQDGLLVGDCLELRLVQDTGSSTTLFSRPGEYCSLSRPVALENAAVFGVSDDPFAIWRTDGTPEGTQGLIPGSDKRPAEVVRFGDEVAIWFWQRHPQSNDFDSELWLTDGTPEGTRKQLDLPDGTQMYGLTAALGRLWFFNRDDDLSVLRQQPSVSDGTPAGTYPLTSIVGDSPGFYGVPDFVEAGGHVWFLFRELGRESMQIWGSDGTPAGTGPAVTAASGAVHPDRLFAMQDRLYFLAARADDPRGRLRPWVSDGTDGGTALLADVEVPDLSFDLSYTRFVEFAGRVWFAATDRQHGTELWSTDGTPEGTSRLDIAPGLLGSYPQDLVAWDGRLWFAAQDGVHGMELWTSDGTAEGTRMVQDIHPGPSWSMPAELTPAAAGLFFSANDGEHGRELWLLPDF